MPGFNILKPKPQVLPSRPLPAAAVPSSARGVVPQRSLPRALQEDQSTPPQTPKAQLKQAASRPAADSGAGFEFPSFQSLLEPAAKPEPKAEPAPAALEPEKPARKVGPQPVQPVRKEQQKDLQVRRLARPSAGLPSQLARC